MVQIVDIPENTLLIRLSQMEMECENLINVISKNKDK